MNLATSTTTDTNAPSPQDRLDAAAGERRALQEELAEMRLRRDSWKERANRLAADVDALKLAVQEITEDRDRAARLAGQRQEEITRVTREASVVLAALEAANARILELDAQKAAAVGIAEGAEAGWRSCQVDRDAEAARANRLEAFVSELALAVGQPTLRGQELLDHVRETEQLVLELRQVCAEQKHELRCAAEREAQQAEVARG